MITADTIYGALDRAQKQDFRRWLGASLIGHPCSRYIAFKFRCAFNETFPPRILRVFENGHKAEDRMVADIDLAGYTVSERQKEISLPGGLGHTGVTLDGIVFDPTEGAHKVLELKTTKASDWNKLAKDGVQVAKPQHFSQMQFGMRCTGLKGAIYVAENKDTNELYVEEVLVDFDHANKLVDLAIQLVTDGNFNGFKCSDRPDWWQCKFCGAFDLCHGERFPRAHCLTCCHSTPSEGGKWTCARAGGNEIPDDVLPCGCDFHIFIPWMINMSVLDGDQYWVSYNAEKYLGMGARIVNTDCESFPRIDDGTAPFIGCSKALENKTFSEIKDAK